MDLGLVRAGLAAQITAQCGLRALAQGRDSVVPPVAVVVPSAGQLISYGDTMGPGGAVTVNLTVIILVADSALAEQAQAQLDGWCGIGSGGQVSVPDAIAADPTLGGVVEWAVPVSLSRYGRLQWAAETYWGAHLAVQAGSM